MLLLGKVLLISAWGKMASILNYFKKKPKHPSEALRDMTVGDEELRDINPVGREEVCKQLMVILQKLLVLLVGQNTGNIQTLNVCCN